MSSTKRLAKRSIIGSRVSGPNKVTGLYHPGVIIACKNPDEFVLNNCHSGVTPNSKYVVRFDGSGEIREFSENELIGPGFGNVSSLKLKPKQKAFVTHNGREVCGTVVYHRPQIDEVLINIQPQSPNENAYDLTKKLDEIRLLESRKSARLQEQDFDFARLADMTGERDRKRSSQQTASIDVPRTNNVSRKRRPSSGNLFQSLVTVNNAGDDVMDDVNAAMVLMSLSCSPHSPQFNTYENGMISSSWSSSSSGASSMLSANFGTPGSSGSCTGPGIVAGSAGSNDLLSTSSSSHLNNFSPTPSSSDDGIESDVGAGEWDEPRRKRNRLIFKCVWRGCSVTKENCYDIEAHVRSVHLADQDNLPEHEEEFYYTEVEVPDLSSPAPAPTSASLPPSFTLSAATIQQHHVQQHPNLPQHHPHQGGTVSLSSSVNLSSMAFSPTLSHLDMVRPASEDPEYKLNQAQHQRKSPNNTQNPKKRLSPKSSPVRRPRGDTKKCRKVYGMDRRELWCTQCKWKKACTRFGD